MRLLLEKQISFRGNSVLELLLYLPLALALITVAFGFTDTYRRRALAADSLRTAFATGGSGLGDSAALSIVEGAEGAQLETDQQAIERVVHEAAQRLNNALRSSGVESGRAFVVAAVGLVVDPTSGEVTAANVLARAEERSAAVALPDLNDIISKTVHQNPLLAASSSVAASINQLNGSWQKSTLSGSTALIGGVKLEPSAAQQKLSYLFDLDLTIDESLAVPTRVAIR
jgi:hypothetical protein